MGGPELKAPATFLVVASWLSAFGCGQDTTPAPSPDVVAESIAAGWHVDSVGVRNLSEGDTLNLDAGLTAIETTRAFHPKSDGGEVFAWAFDARTMNPVKLVILRPFEGTKTFEVVGESPMVVPRQLGLNVFELPEPIPLTYPSLFGFYMPEGGVLPFRRVRNWKMLISQRPLPRPFIDRATFAMYGWRYGLRVYWRKKMEAAESSG